MLILEIDKFEKYYNDRSILKIDNLKIYSEDKIGIVGPNGSGKTTLMRAVIGEDLEYKGVIKLNCSFSYISQLSSDNNYLPQVSMNKFQAEFNVSNQSGFLSSGEKTRMKIAESLNNNSPIIFADEPTNNLDMEGINLFVEKMKKYNGAVLIVSHNRKVLNSLCNKIISIEGGKIKMYKGNYDDYKFQKEKERERSQFLYEEYENEKKRLLETLKEKKGEIKAIRNAPRRMGNSEARLHKMGNQKAKKKLDNSVKNIENRIEKLEKRERPKIEAKVRFNFSADSALHSKIVIKGEDINLSYGNKIIYKNAEFKLYKGWKTGFFGPNGCGKSSLIKLITDRNPSISLAEKAEIGYFNQELNILEENKTILENLKGNSSISEGEIRNLLSLLLFRGDDVYKTAGLLSGGERVKASIGKLILMKPNLLLLDEPTNFLDIYSIEALESALKEYDGTILFVSHDESFLNNVADHVMFIEDCKLKLSDGNYESHKKQQDRSYSADKESRKKVLQNRLSFVIGRLSIPTKKDNLEELNKEYESIIRELKEIN
ncbi:MAG: ABC-F type ribosomal protection protein [Bacillota bacterium]|nr:ABC-F type ribosomal protection protein [Bacillota bacterium]